MIFVIFTTLSIKKFSDINDIVESSEIIRIICFFDIKIVLSSVKRARV